jgi:O-antigen biosynthesis protein WbqP
MVRLIKGCFEFVTSGHKANMKRIVDLVVSLSALVILIVPIVMVAILVKLTSKGFVLYWSDRVGRKNNIFRMHKFLTMRLGTLEMATHLMKMPVTNLSRTGGLLRRSSLDELPQLWSILKGDMSLVGPRPVLFNQDDLISLRTEKGVDKLMHGLTGWAQVNGWDELPIPEKVALDVEYMERQSLWFDMMILWLTVLKVVRRDGISH